MPMEEKVFVVTNGNLKGGDYMSEQISIFDFTRKSFQIDKKIRLIELFAGY